MTRSFEITRRFDLSPSYCVSESGKIGRIGTTAWLKPAPAKRGGYLAVSLWENGKARTWPVHQVVAIAFRGPRPTPRHDAAHDDGDKAHNHWRNVFWKTRAENEADKVRHGTSNRGERNGQAKLTDAECAEMRRLAAAGATQSGLAERFSVSQSAVSNIVNRKRRSA